MCFLHPSKCVFLGLLLSTFLSVTLMDYIPSMHHPHPQMWTCNPYSLPPHTNLDAVGATVRSDAHWESQSNFSLQKGKLSCPVTYITLALNTLPDQKRVTKIYPNCLHLSLVPAISFQFIQTSPRRSDTGLCMFCFHYMVNFLPVTQVTFMTEKYE